MFVLFILLAVLAMVVNANAWFVIPDIIITLLWVLAGATAILKIIILIVANHKQKNFFDKF